MCAAALHAAFVFVCGFQRASSHAHGSTQTKMNTDEGSALVSVLVRGICQPCPSTSDAPSSSFHSNNLPQKPGLASLA